MLKACTPSVWSTSHKGILAGQRFEVRNRPLKLLLNLASGRVKVGTPTAAIEPELMR
jgi:hypothetical protein